jgi:hypothetical protein
VAGSAAPRTAAARSSVLGSSVGGVKKVKNKEVVELKVSWRVESQSNTALRTLRECACRRKYQFS